MRITNATYIISGVKKKHFPENPYNMFVFLGRSNVGKSSFINGLCNRKNLAYTSSKPGKTITLNFYNINDAIMFVDVPGYGYAERTKQERLDYGNMMEELCIENPRLKTAFLIMDLRHDPTEDDILMYNWLKHYNINVKCILTKADKVGKTMILRQVKPFKEILSLTDDDYIVVSSETKLGFDKVLALLD